MKRKYLLGLVLTISAGAFIFGSYWISFHPPTGPVHSTPERALDALENASEVVLYSLHPYPRRELVNGEFRMVANEGPDFHGYRVLGQTTLGSEGLRLRAADVLRHSLRSWRGEVAMCFSPRHGIRATSPEGVHDFVICFECSQMKVVSPDGTEEWYGIAAMGDRLNQTLRDASVPLPKE